LPSVRSIDAKALMACFLAKSPAMDRPAVAGDGGGIALGAGIRIWNIAVYELGLSEAQARRISASSAKWQGPAPNDVEVGSFSRCSAASSSDVIGEIPGRGLRLKPRPGRHSSAAPAS
jgi:hypothetical protein